MSFITLGINSRFVPLKPKSNRLSEQIWLNDNSFQMCRHLAFGTFGLEVQEICRQLKKVLPIAEPTKHLTKFVGQFLWNAGALAG